MEKQIDKTHKKRANQIIRWIIIVFILFSFLGNMTIAQEGLNKVQLTYEASDQRNPSFSLDGSGIIYSTLSPGNTISNYSIWTMNLDGSNKSEVGEFNGFFGHARFCLDDTHLIYGTYAITEGGLNLTMTNIETGETINISRDGYPSLELFSVSPDGEKAVVIAYANTNVDWHILLIDLKNGSIEKEIYYGPISPFSPPTFFPDGSQIAFVVGSSTIRFLDLSNNNTWQLSNITGLEEAVISPDGNEILYQVGVSKPEIWAMTIDGNNRTFITNGTDPSYSPDGTKIVYSADEDGDGYYDIWIMDKPPLDTDGNGTSDGNGTIDGFPYYLLLPVIVILIAIPVIYVVYKRNKHKAKEDDKEEP